MTIKSFRNFLYPKIMTISRFKYLNTMLFRVHVERKMMEKKKLSVKIGPSRFLIDFTASPLGEISTKKRASLARTEHAS